MHPVHWGLIIPFHMCGPDQRTLITKEQPPATFPQTARLKEPVAETSL